MSNFLFTRSISLNMWKCVEIDKFKKNAIDEFKKIRIKEKFRNRKNKHLVHFFSDIYLQKKLKRFWEVSGLPEDLDKFVV